MQYYHIHLPRLLRYIRTITTILFILFGNLRSEAQVYPVSENPALNGYDGYFTMQDSRGFIWGGVQNNITRFDGTELIKYENNDSAFNSTSSYLFEDTNGIIWAKNRKGLSKFTGDRFEYIPIPSSLNIQGFPSEYMVNGDKENTIYLAALMKNANSGKIVACNDGTYSVYSSRFKALDTLDVVEAVSDTSENILFILTRNRRLWSWKKDILVLVADDVTHIQANRNGLMFVSGDNSFYSYSNGKLNSFRSDYLSLESGIVVKHQPNSIEVGHLNGITLVPFRLPISATAYFVDNEGCLWLGTDNSIKMVTSTAFSSITNEETGLHTIWSIASDKKGHIWFGSLRQGYLVEFDGRSFTYRNEFKKLFPGTVGFYKGTRVMKNGDIWFSLSTGVLIWDGKTFSRLMQIPYETQICYIYEDTDDGRVMLGTNKGLFTIHGKNTDLDPRFVNKYGVIEGITKDADGFYWLSGSKGVYKYDGKNCWPVNQGIIPTRSAYTSVTDRFGGIWITSGSGLFFKERGTEKFTYGLPSQINSVANSIILIDNSKILVGRVSDICIIDLEKFYGNEKDYYRIYDKSDGFDGINCLDNGIIRDNSGIFWILTSDRVVRFDHSRLKKNLDPPKLNITGIYFQNDSLEWVVAEKAGFFYKIPENIILKSYQNNIKITYIGISTTNPSKVTYRYMLEGYDKAWSLPSFQSSHNFQKLPPGNYTFLLKASNADGIETADPLSFHFTILPSFWQTKLFFFIIIIASIAAIVSITWFILKRKQQRKEQKEQLIQELSQLQMKLVIRQFDPHFTFNVISSVGTLILREQREIAYDYIIKLASLLRTVLSEGSPMIKPLSEELDFVQRYCELTKLRFKERFCFTINVDSDVNTGRLIPKMLIQTFVENSIKHGFENLENGGQVDISLCRKNNYLQILIRDNGIGRSVAAIQKSYGTGHGLKIISAIFEEMNIGNESPAGYEIVDLAEADHSSGTEIRIMIPDDYRFVIHKKRYEKKYTLV